MREYLLIRTVTVSVRVFLVTYRFPTVALEK